MLASVSVTDSVSDCVSLSELDGYVSRLGAQSAQQTAVSQNEAQHKITINSDLVVLPVTVKDGKGNLVTGLEQRNFRVFDDGIEQIIDVFTSEASPLSLVLLVDRDLKSKDSDKDGAESPRNRSRG